MKKIAFLCLLLLAPILLFLFFRLGKSEYRIPIYHMETAPEVSSECSIDYPIPYRVLKQSQLLSKGVTVIAFVDQFDRKQYETMMNWYGEIVSTFTDDAIHWVSVYSNHAPLFPIGKMKMIDSIAYRREKMCYYISGSYDIVLIDALRRIRGYYSDSSFKEMNRLMAELKILIHTD